MDTNMEVEDSDIECENATKDIDSDDGLIKKEEKEMEEEEEEEIDESFCDINTSQTSSQYHRNMRLSSYSINSSINSSSFLTVNDMNNNIECCWNDINELRVNYLNDIKDKMNIFKNSLCLWNEGGFIPLFTNFISWINEANIEINNLLNRLTSNTIYIQRFVKLYKKQQISLQHKTKQMNDIEFENNTLKKENEWLRLELLNLTKTMSTISTSHQQIKYLNHKQNDKEQRLFEKLENIENIENDENDKYHQLEGVTIFNQNESKQNIKRMNKNKNNKSKKTQQIKRSNSLQYLKSTNSMKNDNKSEKENKGKKPQKKVISYSRSFRHSKLKTLQSKIGGNKGRRNSVNDININMIKQPDRMKNIKENIPSTIPKPKQRKSLSTLSAIKRPSASLRRLSYSNNANNE